MSEDMPDIQLLVIEVNGGNDPVFIAANIKNIIRFNFVRGVERHFNLGEAGKRSGLDDLAPCLHRGSSP
jgi:hypothetical protein